MIHQGVFVGID